MRPALVAILVLLVVVLLYLFVPGVRDQPWTAIRITGATIGAIGYVLVVLARVQLGSAFSVRPQATALVTHGLYSRLRNPMYIFLDAMLFGLILVFGVPWLIIILAALAVFQTIQARREARVLEAKFGQEYLNYRRRTWA